MRTTGDNDLINGLHLLGEASKGNVQVPPTPTPKETLDKKIHEAIEEFEMATGGVVAGLTVDLGRRVVLEVA